MRKAEALRAGLAKREALANARLRSLAIQNDALRHAPQQRSALDTGRRHEAKQSFTHGRDDGLGEPERVQLWPVTLPADG